MISTPPDVETEVIDRHDLLTPEHEARLAAYLAEPKVLPKPGVDRATGRALPVSEEERKARWEAYERRMAEISAMDDEDPPGTWERFVREINEDRRLDGMRPIFKDE